MQMYIYRDIDLHTHVGVLIVWGRGESENWVNFENLINQGGVGSEHFFDMPKINNKLTNVLDNY